jgi:hypothetical protein
MLDNLTVYAYATVTGFIFATLIFGSVYIFDNAYNQPESKNGEDGLTVGEFATSQSVSSCPYPFPEVSSEQPYVDTFGQCILDAVEQPEPSSNPVDNTEAISTSGHKRYASDYRHEFWPSPRPVNFVKALVKADHVHIEGRLTHGKAIELLASRAEMKPDDFLRVDPLTYTKAFMPSQYNAAMLLGQSIQRLEDTIRRHQYLNTLRRHG